MNRLFDVNQNDDAALDRVIDRATESLRQDALDPAAVQAAADRTWQTISAAAGTAAKAVSPAPAPHVPTVIEGDAAFMALIPRAIAGTLTDAEKVLFDDRVRESVPLRRAYQEARAGGSLRPATRLAFRGRRGFAVPRWAVAACAMLAVGAGALLLRDTVFAPHKSATLLTGGSGVMRVSDHGAAPLTDGATFAYGETIRTPQGRGAVLQLADGSRVEMRERTELTLAARRSDTDIRLGQGSVIVEASRQGSGHLYLSTEDCLVSVKGTVFSVSHGTKGSRVSVLEGEVHVEQGQQLDVLRPGDQLSTNPALIRISLADDIGWSQNLDKHLALIRQFQELQKDIASLPAPAPRTSQRLLDLAPEGTAIFAAMPNVSGMVSDAHRLFLDKLRTSAELRDWWAQQTGSADGGAVLEQIVSKVRTFGDQLGDEVALAVNSADGGRFHGVVVLSTLKSPDQFRALLGKELEQINVQGSGDVPLRIVSDEEALVPLGNHLDMVSVWVHGDLLVVATDRGTLAKIARIADAPSANAFLATPLHQRLARAYEAGAMWLAGADVQSLGLAKVAASHPDDTNALATSGITDIQFLVLEGHDAILQDSFRVTVEFAAPRRGLMTWLDGPGPMRSLQFISPNATAAGAVVVKDPAAMFEDVLGLAGAKRDQIEESLRQVRQDTGVDLREDILKSLGGEVAFALDGPMLPKPAWRLIFEVYDAARLQRAIETLVTAANGKLATHGGTLQLTLTTETTGGVEVHTLQSADGQLAAYYTFADGFLVAAPQRALLDRSLENKRNGLTLLASSKFTALLPKDGEMNVSAFVYQDLGRDIGNLIAAVGGAQGQLSPEAQAQLQAAAASATPTLDCLYAEPTAITFAGRGHAAGSMSILSLLDGLQGLRHGAAGLEPPAPPTPPAPPALDKPGRTQDSVGT